MVGEGRGGGGAKRHKIKVLALGIIKPLHATGCTSMNSLNMYLLVLVFLRVLFLNVLC